MSDAILIIRAPGCDIDEAALIRAACATLRQQARVGELSIALQDAAAIAELNQQHRGVNAPTDALAFPAAGLPAGIDEATSYLGDIVIAHDYAAAQARKQGVRLREALCLLVVHATLHLLGHRHETEAERVEMWAAQAEILSALGLDSDIVRQYGGEDG